MSIPYDKIFSELIDGKIVKTRPKDQLRYGTNQVPDIIRKIRSSHGSSCVETIKRTVVVNGHHTRVAEYRMSSHVAAQILGKQYRDGKSK